MNTISKQLSHLLQEYAKTINLLEGEILITRPEFEEHGDYSTSLPLAAAKSLKKNPLDIAKELQAFIEDKKLNFIEKIEVKAPGFVNFFVSNSALIENLQNVTELQDTFGTSEKLKNQKIMVEYAHPNTHKEMHIGHMRTLITGEAVARILEAAGAEVFRANYQGDIGMHVAKAIFGIQKMITDQKLSVEDLEKKPNAEKAHFLGQAYALGSSEYESHKEEINTINTELYQQTGKYWDLYIQTRQWSLDYYEDFYKQFYTRFDRLFFESEMADPGVKIVKDHIGSIFVEDKGAVIFEGEKYGLHTRVFITQKGTPTYEAKDMANAYKQYEAFPFDRNIHVVASEQAGYFQVIIKALALLDPEKFEKSEYHLSMGMVQLKDPSAGSGQAKKISSRTGEVFTVDSLIDDVRKNVEEVATDQKVDIDNKNEVLEAITIAAIKYSVLKTGTGQNALFDIKSSVSLEGNSGPYLQYTYARTKSVLAKIQNSKFKIQNSKAYNFNSEERSLLRVLVYFPEIVELAAENLQPNIIANYLYDLAQKFNLFYQKHKILESDSSDFRLAITHAVGQTIHNGLNLLGIKTVEKM